MSLYSRSLFSRPLSLFSLPLSLRHLAESLSFFVPRGHERSPVQPRGVDPERPPPAAAPAPAAAARAARAPPVRGRREPQVLLDDARGDADDVVALPVLDEPAGFEEEEDILSKKGEKKGEG